LTTLEAEAAVAPLAEIDYGLRLLAQHCRNTETPVPVLKYLALNATEANLYFEQDITNLPAPFQSTMDANLWNLPFGSLDTSEPLDISAPYPALITVGDDTQGAALMLNLEYVGTLQLHDPFQGTGQVNTINQIIGSIAAELLLNPWAEGLHLGLLAAGIGPGDEVIVPSFTFAATGNSVAISGAVPVFADIDPEALCSDPAGVESRVTPSTTGILGVHVYGVPCDVHALDGIAHVRNERNEER